MPDFCMFCAPRPNQVFNPRTQHQECALRSAVGGIGHLTNHDYWCNVAHDPDAGHTFRRSALLVWDWVQEYGLDAAVAVESNKKASAPEREKPVYWGAQSSAPPGEQSHNGGEAQHEAVGDEGDVHAGTVDDLASWGWDAGHAPEP